MCERWVGDWTDCNILTPSSSVFSSTSFSFCWAAHPGVLRAQPSARSWFSLSRTPTNWLQLSQFSVAPGYIIVSHPPASCERRICTEFNPSTVKVILWYLRPDAPVIYTGASLIWQLGQGSICNNSSFCVRFFESTVLGDLELTYSNYVRTQDVTLKTCRRRWMIGRSGERGSGISVLAARHDDDDV